MKAQTQNGNEQDIPISANYPSDQLNDMRLHVSVNSLIIEFCIPADTRDFPGERIIAPERDPCTRSCSVSFPFDKFWISFQDDKSRETILALKHQIAELSSEAKVSQAGERQRDIQYARMKSLPISHGVYDQYKDVTEEPNSDKDDEDYYVDNTPPHLLKLNVF
ncbi:hypothetical protein BC332_24067 [Capsicum chinense]|nr:hypothetical protein BC332_24067 [Capsicum chinense]